MDTKAQNPGILEAVKRSGTSERPGSTHTLAALLGVKQPTVMYWLDVAVPIRRAIQIEEALGVSRRLTCPEFFQPGGVNANRKKKNEVSKARKTKHSSRV